MRIKTIMNGPLQENCYLIWEEGADSAVMIDPGDEALRLRGALDDEHLRLGAILVTHAHLDHVGAVSELRAWSRAVVCFPEQEKELLDWLPESYRLFGLPAKAVPEVDVWLPAGIADLSAVLSAEQLGGLEIAVHPTPGHTAGGVSYQIGANCFVGDTLFRDSVGRTDLPGGSWSRLQESLQRLMQLPADIVVYPGHGPPTTIGRERETNLYLQDLQPSNGSHA